MMTAHPDKAHFTGESHGAGSPEQVSTAFDDQSVVQHLKDYLAAVEEGSRPNLQELVAQHPEIAEELTACLKGLDFVCQVAPHIRQQAQDAVEADSGDLHGPVALGDYRIVREIGRGGMGVVYEAEQLSLGRRVALKVLPFAAVLDQRHLQRFRNEAQAAASLDHPNIVHVYSVGCERAVHFYAMQYIEGQTLAEVIAQLRQGAEAGDQGAGVATSVATPSVGVKAEGGMPSQREALGGHAEPPDMPTPAPPVKACHPADSPPHPLTPSPPPAADTRPLAALSTERSARDPDFFRTVARLGIQAAEALEHAHGMGVVHRDIKPSNLMVESRLPSPAGGRGAGGEGRGAECPHLWITDFGLAMTQTDTNLTMSGDILGTLRYMSPEQVEAKHGVLDHRTDVYSLGLTLYELLTLQPAFPGDDRQRLLRQVAEDDPCPPRQLNQAIPRDLETIVLKATAKKPESRYATAQGLADDLRRFAEDKPIQARRPSPVERAARWARRHRPVVWSAAAILMMAVVALSVSTLLIARAYDSEATQRQRADKNYDLARDAVDSLLDRLARMVEAGSGFGDLNRLTEISKYAVELDKKLPDEIRSSAGHQLRLASMQYRCGLCAANWGHYRRAVSSLDAAMAIYKKLPPEVRAQHNLDLAYCYYYLGHSLQELGKSTEAEESYRQCLRLFSKAGYDLPADQPVPSKLQELIRYSRQAYSNTQEAKLRRTIAELTAAIERRPEEAANYKARADAYRRQGYLDEAIRDYDEAIRLEPDVITSYQARGYAYSDQGDMDALMANWDEAVRENPTSGRARTNRGWYRTMLGDIDGAIDDYTRAVELDPQEEGLSWLLRGVCHLSIGDLDKAMADFNEALRLDPTDAFHTYTWRGDVYWEMGNPQQALADYGRAIEADPDYTLAYCRRAYVRASLGQIQDALADLSKTSEVNFHPALRETGAAMIWHLQEVAWFLANCPDSRLRDPDRAVQLAKQAIALRPNFGYILTTLGAAQYRVGDFPAARQTLLEAARRPSFRTGAGSFLLAMTCCKQGDQEEAHRHYEKGVKWMDQRQPAMRELSHLQAEAAELLRAAERRPSEKEESAKSRPKATRSK